MFTQLSTASRMTLEPWGSGLYWTMLSYYPSLYLLSSIFWEDSVLGRQLWEDQVLGRQLVSPTHLTNTQWKVCLKSDASRLFTHHLTVWWVSDSPPLITHSSSLRSSDICGAPGLQEPGLIPDSDLRAATEWRESGLLSRPDTPPVTRILQTDINVRQRGGNQTQDNKIYI